MSSSSSNNRSTFQKWTVPECDKLDKLAKRSTMLNSVGVFFAVVSIILIIIALVYTYMETTDETKQATYTKIAGGLIIATLFTVVITALVGIWQIVVNKEMGKCLAPKTGGQAAGPSM